MIDYKELLQKYIHHILEMESNDYIDDIITEDDKKVYSQLTVIFSDEEIDELRKLAE